MINGTIETQRFLVDYQCEIIKKWEKKKISNIQIKSIMSTGEFYETIYNDFEKLTFLEKELITLKIENDANEQLSKQSLLEGKKSNKYK